MDQRIHDFNRQKKNVCYNGDISYKYISAQYRKEIFDGKKERS